MIKGGRSSRERFEKVCSEEMNKPINEYFRAETTESTKTAAQPRRGRSASEDIRETPMSGGVMVVYRESIGRNRDEGNQMILRDSTYRG